MIMFFYVLPVLLLVGVHILISLSSSHAQEIKTTSEYNQTWMDIEEYIRRVELTAFPAAMKRMRDTGYSMRGFYHTSDSGKFWKEVISEQLMLMDGRRFSIPDMAGFYSRNHSDIVKWDPQSYSSLLSEVDSLHLKLSTLFKKEEITFQHMIDFYNNELKMNITGKDKINLKFNFTIPRHARHLDIRASETRLGSSLTCGEMSTIMELHNYCTDLTYNQQRRGIVFYVHSKSTCCARSRSHSEKPPHWREFMNTFVLEFPSICINALMNGYSTCGVNYRRYTTPVPVLSTPDRKPIPPHYSGNFWWAKCDHIASLPAPTKEETYNAFSAEWFPLTVFPELRHRRMYGDKCAKNIHDSEVIYYDNYTRNHYIHLVKEALNQDLYDADRRTKNETADDAKKKIRDLREDCWLFR